MSKKVVVGMSGGVDSSVAAWLLRDAGFDVVGLFMHNWEEKDSEGICCATEDYEDVKRVSAKIGIPYYSVNFSKEYYDRVFKYFLKEYESGRTPNPDVLCNREIKFKPFMDYAISVLGADYVATGHYCNLTEMNGTKYLSRALDETKEQSYFLNQVPRERFDRVMFPLANLRKTEVRRIADEQGLSTARKKDSTGICFIGERNFKNFLSAYLPACGGSIVDTDGRAVGRHDGLMYYTLGQRKGLGIGGDSLTDGGRWFVVGKDLKTNRLIVSCGDESPLMKSKLCTEGFNWIAPAPATEFDCLAQVRYRQTPRPARVKVKDDGVEVVFSSKDRAITEGQYCVLYEGVACGALCYGGGVIKSVSD